MASLRTRAIAALFLLGISLLAGCPKKDDPRLADAQGRAAEGGGGGPGGGGSSRSGQASTDEEGRRLETLSYESDGYQISGLLMLPARTDPAPTLVLVPMLGADRSTWTGFQELLADEGIGSYAIDLRGHGASEGGPDGHTKFTAMDWQAALSDVRNAVANMKEIHGVDAGHLAVGGASIGGNYAILVGEDEDVPVVALSAGKTYRGVATMETLPKIAGRVLLAGMDGDAEAHALLEWATDQAPAATIWTEGGSEHGTNMLPNGGLEAQILEFLRSQWNLQPGEPGSSLPEGLPEQEPLISDDWDGTGEEPSEGETAPDEETPDEETPGEDAPPDADPGEGPPEETPDDDGGWDDFPGGGDDGGGDDGGGEGEGDGGGYSRAG